jgi:sugar lactone lactonase YvrE
MPALTEIYTGLTFPESPRWHSERLWVADWGASELVAIEPEGSTEVVARIESFPFSIDWLPDGRLAIVSAAHKTLFVSQDDGATLVQLCDLTELSDKPWNEIVVDGRGNVYLNNIGFDFPGGEFSPGFVAVVTAEGETRKVADGFGFPNGMAVTGDGKTLIVAESYSNCLTAFEISSDGSLSDRRVWADLGTGVPDGICMDAEGAVWYADVPNHCCVRVREGGEVLQTVTADRGCFACMLGGTAGMNEPQRAGQILAIEAPAPHAGRP